MIGGVTVMMFGGDKPQEVKLFLELVFFITYPALSILFYAVGLGASWHPLIVIGAGALMLAMSLIMGKPVALHSPNIHSFRILMLVAVLFSFMTAEYPALGIFLGVIPVLVILFLLIKLQRFQTLVDPKDYRVFALYWFIYVLSASIPTSADLARINYMVNLFPIFLTGAIFGWFGPEVTYRIIGGVYGSVKALLLIFALFIITMLSSAILQNIPALKHLVLDFGIVYIDIIISMYSMLISRIIFDFLKSE